MNHSKSITRLSVPTILKTLEERKDDLQRMGVLKIGLFGSYRRGKPGSSSDMDFVVKLEQPTFDAYMDVKIYLEDLFSCPVDLVIEETIKPRLRPYIMDEVVYAAGF
jgi:uncharacterized protein